LKNWHPQVDDMDALRARSFVRTLRCGRATYVVGADGTPLQLNLRRARSVGETNPSANLSGFAVATGRSPKAVIDAELDTHQSHDDGHDTVSARSFVEGCTAPMNAAARMPKAEPRTGIFMLMFAA
jgi:hypothetical protein